MTAANVLHRIMQGAKIAKWIATIATFAYGIYVPLSLFTSLPFGSHGGALGPIMKIISYLHPVSSAGSVFYMWKKFISGNYKWTIFWAVLPLILYLAIKIAIKFI